MSVQVSQLTKRYGTQTAVNQVSFSVQPGEIIGFLGPNGAGKSTTMKMITGYLQPDGGRIAVCGKPVSITDPGTRQHIGYLPEANPLYLDMYVREYLAFVAKLHHVKNLGAAVERVINLTGLTPEAHKKAGQLSKGYKQRVGLAAALVHDPQVLILDEPTSGLDPNQIMDIRDVIRNLGQEKTVIFSSHILQEVEAVCSRVIIINKGHLVADDTLDHLRQQSSGHSLTLRLQEAAACEGLIALGGQADPQDSRTWIFQTNQPDQLKRAIMAVALRDNLNIQSMDTGDSHSLEAIFRSLTQPA
jgi:ABC-2 type transport system ATP-binding protein